MYSINDSVYQKGQGVHVYLGKGIGNQQLETFNRNFVMLFQKIVIKIFEYVTLIMKRK